jgi:hypothetical protein
MNINGTLDKIRELIIISLKAINGNSYSNIEEQIIVNITTPLIEDVSKYFFYVTVEQVSDQTLAGIPFKQHLRIEAIDGVDYVIYNLVEKFITEIEINVYVDHIRGVDDYVVKFPSSSFNPKGIANKVCKDIRSTIYSSKQSIDFQKVNNIDIFPINLTYNNLSMVENDNGLIERMMFKVKAISSESTELKELLVNTIEAQINSVSNILVNLLDN